MGFEFVALSLPPLVIGTLAAMACALPGNFLLLRRQALIGDAISHVALPGIVVAFLLTGAISTWPMMVGAAGAAVIAVVVSVPFAMAFKVIKLMIFEAGFSNAVSGSVSFIVAYTGFGIPVAALWGATISVIYQRLDRRFPVRAEDQ